MELLVVKRDGSVEKFNENKILRVVIAAGLTSLEAKKLLLVLIKWMGVVNSPQITTTQIRDKVVEELKRLNKNAADLYLWYEKSKKSFLKEKVES